MENAPGLALDYALADIGVKDSFQGKDFFLTMKKAYCGKESGDW